MVPRREGRHRHGPHRSDRHRLHRPVSAGAAAKYESLATCPDDLLLFLHHVPYDYKLHSGKTLVQSIYDTHYEGALAAAEYVPQWESLKGLIDDERYEKTLDALQLPGRPCHRLARRHQQLVPAHLRHPRRHRAASATIRTASKPRT